MPSAPLKVSREMRRRRKTVASPAQAVVVGLTCVMVLLMTPFVARHLRTPQARAVAAGPYRPAPAPTAFMDHRRTLIIPVEGVGVAALHDTWGVARSEGRRHEGIDIMAPRGARVFAAADGTIVRFFVSPRGGMTIDETDKTGGWIYSYAHLDSRAPGLAEGDSVVKGQVIGFVGATGNATTPHLHFEIQERGPERQGWRATPVNPLPYLLDGTAPADAAGVIRARN